MVLNYILGRGWPPLQVIPGILLTLAAMLLLLPAASQKG